MIRIVPTIVPDSLDDIAETERRYADFLTRLHVDAADGKFAPNASWLPSPGERLTGAVAYEAHLMVADPRAVGLSFIAAGVTSLEAHAEAFADEADGRATLAAWRAAGAAEAGAALLFATPLEAAEPYLADVDYVRLMCIPRIGTQGIPFAEESIARVAEFHRRYPDTPIAVDGGVSEKNIEALARAGTTCFAVGSAIAKAEEPAAQYRRLLALAEGAV
ncbi:MAG: hypothetical protein KGI41_03575 [Patescibacteria group bacterium]|nr:hypothetical protein [Patescibacteria group bacterium]